MNDPTLGDGWAHWVSSKPYHAYVKKYGHQVEVSAFWNYIMKNPSNH
jgi:hypothetical protein